MKTKQGVLVCALRSKRMIANSAIEVSEIHTESKIYLTPSRLGTRSSPLGRRKWQR